jgi:DNA helicase HerA-like ATPase
MLASFRPGKWSWDELIENKAARVHVLQFRGLEGKTQRVLVEVLLWHLFFHLKSHGQQSLRVFLVLDEAHHLSFRETGPLNGLLREARKFGLGIIFASQQPEDFSPVAYSNSASKLVFQTSDPKLKVSKFLAGKVENFNRPEEIRDAIGGLPRGEALFITRNRGLRVRIADFAKRTTLWQHR